MSAQFNGKAASIPWAICALLVKAPREGRALAQLMGYDYRCVMRHLRLAEEEGLIRRERRFEGFRRRKPDVFHWTGGAA